MARKTPSTDRPYILVSNDDGIDSPGIFALARSLARIGDVVVVAPSTQQSAVGHAITVQVPLRTHRFYRNGKMFGWAVDGTPADCVKLAVLSLLDRKPNLVVSGINHGMNTAINVIYSGTVSAATEGSILGIPSIAVSLATHETTADLSTAALFARKLAREVLRRGLPPGTLLNVNIPNVPRGEIAGVKVTEQGKSWWDDGFERRIDPQGREYYWLVGTYKRDQNRNCDDYALRKNFISITPLHYRLTDSGLLREMNDWNVERLW